MNENRMMNQISSIFGVFMTLFYIGVGLYIALAKNLMIDKVIRGIFGFTFVFYGIYRGFRSFQAIKESFFNEEE